MEIPTQLTSSSRNLSSPCSASQNNETAVSPGGMFFPRIFHMSECAAHRSGKEDASAGEEGVLVGQGGQKRSCDQSGFPQTSPLLSPICRRNRVRTVPQNDTDRRWMAFTVWTARSERLREIYGSALKMLLGMTCHYLNKSNGTSQDRL